MSAQHASVSLRANDARAIVKAARMLKSAGLVADAVALDEIAKKVVAAFRNAVSRKIAFTNYGREPVRVRWYTVPTMLTDVPFDPFTWGTAIGSNDCSDVFPVAGIPVTDDSSDSGDD